MAVLPVDGGKITVNGHSADVLGVSPQAFRPWTPLATASSAKVWSDLSQGQLISTAAAARKLHLTAEKSYPVSAAIREQVPFGGPTALSVPGADAIVNLTRSAQLGLAKNFAILINAPRANLKTLITQVQSVIGKRGQVVNLVAYTLVTAGKLPVEPNAPAGVPANWIDLFKASAAQYCPGLSWTVLAAIGEIESGDGANEGPSSAGAEGPMQFIPSTWAIWGTDGLRPDRRAGHLERTTTPCRRPRGCCAPPAAETAPRCPGRSSPTTTRPGTSTRYSRWPASTPGTTPDAVRQAGTRGERRRRRPSRQVTALAAPQTAANAYPARGPCASRMKPTTDEPAARPTPMPLLSQDMASVRRPGWPAPRAG